MELLWAFETLFLGQPKKTKPIIPELPISSDRDPKIGNPSDERGPNGLPNGSQVLSQTPRKPLGIQRFATRRFPMQKTL